MSFTVIAPHFEQTYERWIDALEMAKTQVPNCKGLFQQVKILEAGKLVWVQDRFHRYPQFFGAGTYQRLARQFLMETAAENTTQSDNNTAESLEGNNS